MSGVPAAELVGAGPNISIIKKQGAIDEYVDAHSEWVFLCQLIGSRLIGQPSEDISPLRLFLGDSRLCLVDNPN